MKNLPGFHFAAASGMACALLLGACVPLHSTTPLYSEADAEGAPGLHEGLWLAQMPGGPPCDFDTALPAPEWPSCASKTVIKGGVWHTSQVTSFSVIEESETEWDSQPFLLTAGSPRVLQMTDDSDASRHWIYSFITPTGADGAGVTAFDLSSYYCMLDIDAAVGPDFDLSGLDDMDLFTGEGAENCLVGDRDELAAQGEALMSEIAAGVDLASMPEPEAGDKIALPISFKWIRTPTSADETP